MSSRRIEDLTPELQGLYKEFDARMKQGGIDYIVTCTRRTPEDQANLYAQGRTLPGKIVTWTLKSKHIEGRAFDIVIMENGKPDWNDKNPKWLLAGQIGREVGLSWAGDWPKKKREYPHFEI